MIRSGLSAERIAATHLFVGTPADYLAHRPVMHEPGMSTAVSRRYLADLAPVYPRRPVAFVLEAFDERPYDAWVAAHPGNEVGAGVALVSVPFERPEAAGSTTDLGSVGIGSPLTLLPFGAAVLAFLWVCGLGWTGTLFGRRLRPFEFAALAPGVGIAAVVMTGVLMDRVGVRLVGPGGVATGTIALVTGWGGWWMRHRRERRAVDHAPWPGGM
jgi:hypothetical protein